MRRLKNSFLKWIVVSMICLLLGFLLGKFKQHILTDSLVSMETEVQALSEDKINLSRQVARIEAELMADRQTIHRLTEKNKQLNEELITSANKLYFYERVVAPEMESSGVNIYSFTVDKDSNTGAWNYELVLMQSQKRRRFLTGNFELTFSVFENEQLKNISLNGDNKETRSTFKFKYFQTMTGSFLLPPEVAVDEVILAVKVKGNRWYKAQSIEQRYDWKALIEKDEGNSTEFDQDNLPELNSLNPPSVIIP